MKPKIKEYAMGLVEVLASSRVDPGKIGKNFLALLEKNNDMNKGQAIIALARRYFSRKTKKKHVVLEAARPMKAGQLLLRIADQGDMVEQVINPELVAGVRITVNEEYQLDVSLRRMLETMFLNISGL